MTRDKAIPQLFDFFGSITETGSGFFGLAGPFFFLTAFLNRLSISSGSRSITQSGPVTHSEPGRSLGPALLH
eukprot:COSAG01_NODE_514_length_16043_cov_248.614212_19_plen_72_part_00